MEDLQQRVNDIILDPTLQKLKQLFVYENEELAQASLEESFMDRVERDCLQAKKSILFELLSSYPRLQVPDV